VATLPRGRRTARPCGRLRSVLPIGSTWTLQAWVDDGGQVLLVFAVPPDLPEVYGSGASIAEAVDRCREALAAPTTVVTKLARDLMERLLATGYRPRPRAVRLTDLQDLEEHNGGEPGCATCARIWAGTE
jgi:hypothetical protein